MKRVLITLFVLAAASASAGAHNLVFMPGDAYFSTRLTGDFFDKRVKAGGKELHLRYARVHNERTMKCGYCGFRYLHVRNVPKPVLENLRTVHAELFGKKGGDAEYWMLIVNRDYKLTTPFPLKYNETWASEQTGEGRRGHAVYEGYGKASLVLQDWELSTSVGRLKWDDPRTPLDASWWVDKPMTADAGKLKFLILVGPKALDYVTREDGRSLFEVSETIKKYQFNKQGKPIQVPFEPSQKPDK